MQEKICDFCDQCISFEKIVQWASHRAHCKLNPSRTKRIKKCAESNRIQKEEFKFLCCKCKNEFSLFLTETQSKSVKRRKHCTQKCANRHIQSNETKIKKSKSLKGRKSHKKGTGGQDNFCVFCKETFRTPKTKTSPKFCSRNCLKLFYENQRTERQNYKLMCQFKFNVYDFPTYFDISLIEKFGWYKASNRGNNLNGISRDHLFSIADGFKNKIDPFFMSHPANCCLMQHKENAKKNKHSSITIQELVSKILLMNTTFSGV